MGEREDTAPKGISKAVPKGVRLAYRRCIRWNTLNWPVLWWGCRDHRLILWARVRNCTKN